MENLFVWLITGAVIGLLAIMLDRGKQQSSATSIMLGAVGGFLGGWLLSTFEIIQIDGTPGGVVQAAIGAAILLVLAKLFE